MLTVWIVIPMLVIGLVLWLLWLPITVSMQFTHRNQDVEGKIDVRYLFGLVRLHKNLERVDAVWTDEGPAIRATHGSETTRASRNRSFVTAKEVWHVLTNWPSWWDLVKQMKGIVEQTLLRVHVTRLQCSLTIGTGDVVSTGIACGAAWACMSAVIGRFTFWMAFEDIPRIQVQPNFENLALATDLDCIAWVRAGHAIRGAIRCVLVWRRRKT